LILQTLAEPDLADPGSTNRPTDQYLPEVDSLEDLTGRNIGVPRQFFYEHVDPEILSATERVISFLEKKGATVREVETPDLNFSRTVSLTIQMPEALSFHMPWLEKRAGDYGEDFRTGLALGQQILAEHYVRAKRLMTHYRTQIDDVLETVDILVTPSTPIVAPKVGAVEVETEGLTEPVGNAMMRFTNFFNTTGHPAISIPSGMHSLGLPMGVQLVGKAFGEASLLAFAHLINSHRQFKLPLPKIN
jgi:aspartyl-tRNA(Asn)/glutamyl-tRNA(Gln) amidotransferase subunit A